MTSKAASLASVATSKGASLASEATSGMFLRFQGVNVIAFGSATSRAAASAGHTTLPSNGNWLGITLGLTVGLVGGLSIFMT